MDSRAAPVLLACRLLLVAAVLLCSCAGVAHGNGVLQVRRRFVGRESSPGDFRAHDQRRALSAVDLPLGGDGRATSVGLYYTEIGIGTPSTKYYVQVDTGSDLLWVRCIECQHCPSHSDLGLELKMYDPRSSASGKLVTCDHDFCYQMYGEIEGCNSDHLCQYNVLYGDGSGTIGFFVTDYVEFNQATGLNQFNASITFGCSARQSGGLGESTLALDGIVGFGRSNSSMISQLASSGKVRKMFAHCLDAVNGGGIFAVGHIVHPKVNTTPLVPNLPHYNINMRSIEVGGKFLQLPSDIFDAGERKGTVIDSGTTLAYLPEAAYKPLMNTILSNQPNLTIETTQDLVCFQYMGSVDDGFPVVTFHFENSLSLRVYPHDYIFQTSGDMWCVGWLESGIQSREAKDLILLGDLVLSNKLVLYDLENNAIGWTEYNCSSIIELQDHMTGKAYSITGGNISSAFRLETGRLILLFMMTVMLRCLIC